MLVLDHYFLLKPSFSLSEIFLEKTYITSALCGQYRL